MHLCLSHSTLLPLPNLKSEVESGDKGIPTSDFQLAKLALYQLSYGPVFPIFNGRFSCDSGTVANARADFL
jgi:hypothetical protein